MKRKKNCFNKCLKTSTNKTKILTQSYVQYKQRQLSKEAELLNQVKRGENSQSDTENTCKKKKKKKTCSFIFSKSVNAQLTSQHLSSLIWGLKWTTVTSFCLTERRYIWLLWMEALYCTEGRKAEQLPSLAWRPPLPTHISHQTRGYKGHQFVITQITRLVFPPTFRGALPCHPLLFFRTPLSLLHQSDGGGIRCTFGLKK